jgi:hypothetical protein
VAADVVEQRVDDVVGHVVEGGEGGEAVLALVRVVRDPVPHLQTRLRVQPPAVQQHLECHLQQPKQAEGSTSEYSLRLFFVR